MVGFEPWTVTQMMHKHSQPSSMFKGLLEFESLKLTKKDYLKIAKIQDLVSLANTVIDFMIGKYSEDKSFQESVQQVSKTNSGVAPSSQRNELLNGMTLTNT